MNRDDIIRIAQQFGAVAIVDGHVVWATASGDIVRKLMTAAVEAEREECAKVCEAESAGYGGVLAGPIATERGKMVHQAMAAGAINCAAAIRARSEK